MDERRRYSAEIDKERRRRFRPTPISRLTVVILSWHNPICEADLSINGSKVVAAFELRRSDSDAAPNPNRLHTRLIAILEAFILRQPPRGVSGTHWVPTRPTITGSDSRGRMRALAAKERALPNLLELRWPLLSLLLMMVSGWVHRRQLIVIEFPQTEIQLPKKRSGGKRIRFTNAGDPPAADVANLKVYAERFVP